VDPLNKQSDVIAEEIRRRAGYYAQERDLKLYGTAYALVDAKN